MPLGFRAGLEAETCLMPHHLQSTYSYASLDWNCCIIDKFADLALILGKDTRAASRIVTLLLLPAGKWLRAVQGTNQRPIGQVGIAAVQAGSKHASALSALLTALRDTMKQKLSQKVRALCTRSAITLPQAATTISMAHYSSCRVTTETSLSSVTLGKRVAI